MQSPPAPLLGDHIIDALGLAAQPVAAVNQ